jgi:hypothetical protein
LSQLKQLALATHTFHDTRNALPLASTAAFRMASDNKVKIGTLGVDVGGTAGSPAIYAGQQGDGYSWIVQLLPFIEEDTLYQKLNQQVGTGVPPTRRGKLYDAAFATGTKAATQKPGEAFNATTNPYIFSTKIEMLRCPSYPGNEDVSSGGFFASPTGTYKIGAGNYLALPSTHYRTDGDLESGAPPNGKGCASSSYCGNGVLAFPGTIGVGVSQTVTKKGNGLNAISDGTSKTVMISESRDEKYTSWYSGLASYGVGAWPQKPAPGPTTLVAGQAQFWTFATTGGDHSLNKGSTKDTPEAMLQWYTDKAGIPYPHQTLPRRWGPSSRHPGVVQHGYADGHAGAVNEAIDGDTYLYMITRNGRETVKEQ